MNFPTTLLAVFSKHNGIQDQRDGVMGVPRLLSPVVEIPEISNDTFYGDKAGTILSTSFMWSGSIQINNGAAQTAAIGLSSGLWDIELDVQYQSNYTDVVNVGGPYIAFVFTGASQDFQLFAARPQQLYVAGSFHRRVSFLREDASIQAILAANGAGETDILNWSLQANRLG